MQLLAANLTEPRSLGPDVQLRILRSLAEVEEIRAAWESWPGHRDSDIDVFLAAMGAAQAPHVIAAYREGHPKAILIGRVGDTTLRLKLGYWNFPAPRVRLLTFVTGALRGDNQLSDVLIREALNSLRRREAHLARFDFVEVGSPLFEQARTLPGFLSRDHVVDPKPHWRMSLSTYDETLKGLSGDHRSQFKRKTKALYGAFQRAAVKCLHRPEEIDTILRDVETVAAKSYQRNLGVGFEKNDVIRTLLVTQLRKGWLLCYILYLDETPAAFWMGPLYNHTFYSDFLAFDPAYTKHSPGTVLQAKVIEDLCARQAREIDFGPGEGLYKSRLGTHQREQASIFLYAPTIRGVLLSIVQNVILYVDRTAKSWARRLGIFAQIKRILRRA